MAKQKKQKQQLMRSLKRSARIGQVAVFNKSTGKRETVNVRDIQGVLQYTDEECREYAIARVALNLRKTKHPFHHETALGVIVDSDPTLEYCLSRLSEEQRTQFHAIYAPTPEQEAHAPKAVPVDHKFYGEDMYEGHWGKRELL